MVLPSLSLLPQRSIPIRKISPIAKQHNLITSNGTALLLNNSAGGSNAYVDLDFNTYSVTVAGYANAAATIRVIDDGNYSGDITFRTKANAVDGSQTERMRIKSDGDLYWHQQPSSSASGISFSNTTHPSITVSGGSDTQFRHRMVFINGNGTVGLITTSGSATAYNTASDYRLKENVDYDFNALDRVAQLKPARFNFIADADTTVDGFLAHEVQDIVPEAITGEKDAVDDEGNPDYQGIDQSKLVPLLTKAIQEQQDQIDKLSKEIVKLKKK